MSLNMKGRLNCADRFPRVSGDEPHIHKCEGRKDQFSPPERG